MGKRGDELGQGKLGDGREIFGEIFVDVLLTCAEVVSTEGNMAKMKKL